MKSPTIYRRNLRREKNDRLVSVHTSVDCGDVDSGFTEEDNDDDDDDDEYDDTKIVKSRRSGFSRGKLEAGRNELGLCTARYES